MKNIEFYNIQAKKCNIIKWVSLICSIITFILEFALSLNGIDLFTPFGYILSIIWISGIIVFVIYNKKQERLNKRIEKMNLITEAIEDSRNQYLK